MTDIAYYNEFDKYAAKWLRNLINAGLIAPGVVDDRSIEDVRPDDLTGFTQHHFFAGVGVWSYALRSAGWADHRSVWTASCPCQPYSQAGEGRGFADERHLWPAFHHLHSEYVRWCRQHGKRLPIVLGEQVASSYVDPWVDLVQADLEALAYAFGAVPFPSAGVGAPHIRDRLYWVADPDMRESEQPTRQGARPGEAEGRGARGEFTGCGDTGGLADAYGGDAGAERQQRSGEQRQQPQDGGRGVVALGGLADTTNIGQHGMLARHPCDGGDAPRVELERLRDVGKHPGPTNGFWRDADWLGCRDGKWRPVEPSTFPLANGAASRVGRLRAYGNAINAEAAKVFIQAVMHVVD